MMIMPYRQLTSLYSYTDIQTLKQTVAAAVAAAGNINQSTIKDTGAADDVDVVADRSCRCQQ